MLIDIGETKLHYEDRGTGLPLVFLHAGIGDMRMWDAQVEAFASDYRVVRYDLRGYGQSASPEGEYINFEELGLLQDTLEIEQAVLVGASLGGGVALDFALEYPERVIGLVLVCAGVGGYVLPAGVKAQWAKIEAAYDTGDLAQATELTLQMWIDGPQRRPDEVSAEVREKARVMIQHLYEIPDDTDLGEELEMDPPAIKRLGEISVPTLVMQGALDVAYHIPLSMTLARQIPGAELALLEGAAHLPQMEQPEVFNGHMRAFLEALSA